MSKEAREQADNEADEKVVSPWLGYWALSISPVQRADLAIRVADAVRARELEIAMMAEDTGTNELIRFAQIIRGEGP